MDRIHYQTKFRAGDRVQMSDAAESMGLCGTSNRPRGRVVTCVTRMVLVATDGDGAAKWHKADHWDKCKEPMVYSQEWLEQRAMTAAFRRE